ncbi:hypothetical protein RO21_06105 [[Actinobacillus] muris]|uniref:Uncharacterized protein n=1 Tax=Muribacter muris TaxID=67855 RepID=A0A0J5P6U2_9PAST|nr:hypothetical protein [Muribacter muris]KMK51485.1 hypothetical protein RO21_06105 [[Actinobacillus] muris] [Muribacter muris]
MTELSQQQKQKRDERALAFVKKSLADGKSRQILLRMDKAIADEFDAVLAEFGGSRPQAIKALCEFYRKHT